MTPLMITSAVTGIALALASICYYLVMRQRSKYVQVGPQCKQYIMVGVTATGFDFRMPCSTPFNRFDRNGTKRAVTCMRAWTYMQGARLNKVYRQKDNSEVWSR